jgi:hypothetical protein
MKYIIIFFCCFTSIYSAAGEKTKLTPIELISRISEINNAQNKVMMLGSTKTDVDDLFSLYTDDFVYIHEVYGGTYTRKHLYKNTMKYLKSGGYKRTTDRYKIINSILGINAIAVERLKIDDNVKHLAVFEFDGSKVSKITEYWK